MRAHLIAAFLCAPLVSRAQNTIHSHAIGNWRNGPVVYITPLIAIAEAIAKPELKERFRSQYAELKDIPDMDLDVLLFGTKEEGEESRASLKLKYGQRKLKVVMLDPAPAPKPANEP